MQIEQNLQNTIDKLDELSKKCEKLRQEGKKIVHCHGVFDLVHPGHIKHFEAAKRFGDILVVSITEDKYVNKGPGRPIFNEKIRAETLAAIEFIDFVTINYAPTAVPAIEKIKPNFYVKGQDYKNASDDITGEIYNEKATAEKFGGKLVFTEEIQFSSSNLINSYLIYEDERVLNYLKSIKQKITFKQIEEKFNQIQNLKVLIIGDIILDEYQFVRPMGKAAKSATISVKKLDCELYAGGILAVANHVANFVNKVTLIADYGLNDGVNYYEYINRHLHQNVKWESVFLHNRPTTLKRRFVDAVFKHKLFEITEIDDSPLSEIAKQKILEKIRIAEDYDMIIIADFGHGLMDKEIIKEICQKDVFLALNVQTNSINRGFNYLTKYPRCDYFCIDHEEARLAMHDKVSDMSIIHNELMKLINAKIGTITLGVKGCYVGNNKNDFARAPALSHDVLDTLGAGDAFLSITSLFAKIGASVDEIAFVGNAVGAMAVKILGNKSNLFSSSKK